MTLNKSMRYIKYYKLKKNCKSLKDDCFKPVYGNTNLFNIIGMKVFGYLSSITLQAYLWFQDRA